MYYKKFNFFFVMVIFYFEKAINCISEETIEELTEVIKKENLEKELLDITKTIKEYEELVKIFNSLVEREKKERKRKTFNEKKFKDKYKELNEEANLFKKYFYKQRAKMSNYINKPTYKMPKNVTDIYHSTVEYSLECQDLIKEIEDKLNINKEDL